LMELLVETIRKRKGLKFGIPGLDNFIDKLWAHFSTFIQIIL
jgi:hypothetical protein